MNDIIHSKPKPRAVTQAHILKLRYEPFVDQLRNSQEICSSEIFTKAGLGSGGLLDRNARLSPNPVGKNLELKRVHHFESMQPGDR